MSNIPKSATDEKVASSIPEIYFDIIARVIPGAMAIGVYRFDLISGKLDTTTISYVLLGAYFLGIVMQVIGDLLWGSIFKAWNFLVRSKRLTVLSLVPPDELWRWIRTLPPADRGLFTKMMAEKLLFQSATFIALGIAVAHCSPPWIHLPHTGQGWHIGVPLLAVFTYCMVATHKSVSWNRESYEERAKNQLPPRGGNPSGELTT